MDRDQSPTSDCDSGYWDLESVTQSITSSVYDYEKAHGRTYHAYHSGKYHLPNDVDEQFRIDVKYHAIRLTFNNINFFAPISDPRAILDIGTGTGMWAIDVADAHPDCVVVGTDLSPIQPAYVPPNLEFEISDADEDWIITGEFDLIHCRLMNDFTLRSWPRYFQQAFDHLRPGGWIECQEFDYRRRTDDDTISADSKLKFWENEWTRGMREIGFHGWCDPDVVMQQMRNAGFINVHTKYLKMPIGPWSKNPILKEAGQFGLINLIEGLHGLSAKIFKECLGYSTTQLEVLLMECREELRRSDVHAYYPVYVILGQRPGP